MPVGMLYVYDGVVVIELVGLIVEGLVVDEAQTVDWLYQLIVLAFVKLTHDGL